MSRENNLPMTLSSFVGRERVIDEVRRLLSTARLLTLYGSGGCGKTRLALRVASACAREYPHGIWFVELAALADPELVPNILAAALGVAQQPGRSLVEILVDRLQSAKALILLDNCEHLVLACARLAETLLAACPDLHILSTSREVLNVPGELAWLVPSLSVPDLDTPPVDAVACLQYEAVRLFVERAAAVAPSFALTEHNAPTIVQICQQLDGIPLAIELAAARVRVLPVEQIAARLDQRFDLLRGGARTAPPRQQTLRATLDWSYKLLSPPEQALLRQLSVFAGSWTLEAAAAVIGPANASPADVDLQYEVLDLLAQLLNKSLVVVQTSRETGTVRYSMLDTVRQYAWDRAGEASEQHDLRDGHLAYFLALAEEAEPALHGPQQISWLDRLEAEHDNLRAALHWAIERAGQPDRELHEAALRLAGALLWFWWIRGHPSEGRRWLEEALVRSADVSAGRQARALFCAGFLANFQNDWEQAVALCEQSLALYRSLGDPRGMAWAQFTVAMALSTQDDLARAVALIEESQALWRAAGDQEGVAFSLHLLGDIATGEGDYDRARWLLRESLVMYRAQGNTWAIALSLTVSADAAQQQQDYATASAYLQEGMALSDQLRDRRLHAIFLHLLGEVRRKTGDLAGAHHAYAEALALFRTVGDRWFAAGSLEAAALLACAEAAWYRAGQLFGAADALRATINSPPVTVNRDELARALQVAATSLGESEFRASRSAGCRLGLDQAIALAAVEPEPALVVQSLGTAGGREPDGGPKPGSSDPASRRASRLQYDGLTVREREVAALVAQGMSNHEIAAALVIADRTAAVHIGNILNKLDFTSRAQIAAWAVSKGLARNYNAPHKK